MATLDFDELNMLVKASIQERDSAEDLLKDIRGWLTLAYKQGVDDADEEIEYVYTMRPDLIEDYLNKKIDGKTYEDRILEHMAEGSAEGIQRVVETEAHRMFGQGGYDAALSAQTNGKTVYKKWLTMEDSKVRETHIYLQDMEVPMDEPFKTFDGDTGMFPGDFTNPANNVNCRCSIKYSSGKM